MKIPAINWSGIFSSVKQIKLPYKVILLAFLITIILWITRPQQPPPRSSERAWPVATKTVHLEQLSPVLTLYGRVESPDKMTAMAPLKSQVKTVYVREGQKIKKGQPLVTLGSEDFLPRIAQSESQVREFQAQIQSEKLRYRNDLSALKHEQKLLALNQSAVDRSEHMKKQNLGSDVALDEARQELERQVLAKENRQYSIDEYPARLSQLEAGLAEAQASLELIRLSYERSQIKAPFDGYIVSVDVAMGDDVNANQSLISMYPSDGLEYRATIPSVYKNELQSALDQGVELTAEAIGSQLKLKLDRFSGQADAKGIDALFNIIESSGKLRLGEHLTVKLQRPKHDQVMALPYSAIYGSDRIFRVVKVRMQGLKITRIGEYIDETGNSQLLVASPDLADGDQIVLTNVPSAIEGLLVIITPDLPPTTPSLHEN